MNNKTLQIRNSTAEFLIFTNQSGENSIDVRVENETVWLTQKLMAKLFGVDNSTISEHLKNLYNNGEITKKATIGNFPTVQIEGNREVRRTQKFYNLDAIIAVGFRVNSTEAVRFRRWATQVLKDFAIQGYVLDDIRLKNGAYLGKDYFHDLILQIRDIRQSERNFYQQITDIYATALDYDLHSPITQQFFANVQNKMHFAVHGNTAAEMIVNRADHKKEHMGLTSWKKAPDGKIIKSDVVVAKNYLSEKEIKALNRIVTMYLDYAEEQAEQGIPMTMQDWAKKLNAFLQFNNKQVLENFGTVSAAVAKQFAESEFEKYRPIQDRLFESDFDKLLKLANKNN